MMFGAIFKSTRNGFSSDSAEDDERNSRLSRKINQSKWMIANQMTDPRHARKYQSLNRVYSSVKKYSSSSATVKVFVCKSGMN
jgi:hypothetical protein